MTDRTACRGTFGSGARHLVRIVALAALLLPGALWASTPTAGAAIMCGGSVAEGQIRVVIVVDAGTGGAAGPRASCLIVARGTTGGQLLAERAAALGAPRPRYADSGLLCGIDGFPDSGCGERTGDGYRYWAYFSGTSGSWVYGGGNPFLRRLADGDIEGWRFVDGTGTGQDPPPRITPSAGLFPPLPAPAPAVPAPVPPPAAAPSAAPTPPLPAAGVTGGAATATEAGGAAVMPDGEVPADATEATVTPGDDAPTVSGPVVEDTQGPIDELAASASSGSDASGPGPTGMILAAIVIAGLVAATVVRARSRR